jgi:deoxyhypusine synthase
MIARFGKEINNPDSIYYWCYKNDIPVFCPAITDGAIGDMLFTNSYKNDLVLDVIQDIREINKMAMRAKKSCVVILGGSVPKHHILNAHIWRNGADYGVFINTGLFEDGSDSGAKTSEALTWGKLRLDSKHTKIFGEASIIFPLLVAETFAKDPKKASKIAQKH